MTAPLTRVEFPWPKFHAVCRAGLGVVRPFRNRDFPDPYGWNFGSTRAPSYWAYGRMRALLAEADALAQQPRRVLEVAAGDGALCAMLAARGCTVTANDLRTESLEADLARFSNASQIRVLGGNLFELDPEQTGRFDLVIACEVLEHVAHSIDFLRQLRRFLNPGGRALITTPNGSFFRNKLPTWSQISDFTALESQQFKPDADGHLFLITPDELAHLAVESGFVVERLSVWGSPCLSGNVKFSLLAWPGLDRLNCLGEAAVQFLPPALRSQLCTALVAVLRA
jgi:2-polyprenyl-6-hydroxyphenyl methylase/3-demethylubiquinone-9 3-methyltransferase